MPTADVFRPRLPLDPFDDAQPPWHADAAAQPAAPHTVLVLGAAAHADLAPLALSPHLASSLLLIATHTPPPVPAAAQCPVVILRLPAPLDIHDAGAVRLVGLLDRAQRVAHSWHAAPHAQPRIQQLAELCPGGEFAIAEPPEFALPLSPQPVPGPRPESSETWSLSSASSSSSTFSKRPAGHQYTFSALINFLPPTLPDKALLKHAILVTTLAAPFLAAHPPSSLSDAPARRSRLASFFSSPAPSLASSAESLLPPARHPHLVHVLPYASPSKSKLAQSIEQFLLSFAYPPSASASAPSLSPSPPIQASASTSSAPMHRAAPARSSPLASPAGSLRTTPNARPQPIHLPHSTHAPNSPAIPYLLPAGLLGAYPAGSQRSVGEMVLGGVLDCVAIGAAEACISVGMGGWPRAWLGGTGDVVVQSRVQTEVVEDQYAEHAKHEQTRTRRNEAGLPTPPESSSSSGGSDDDDGSGSCSPSDDGSCSDADADADATEDSHPSHISHVSAPVLGTNTHDREVLSGSGKTMSEAHFRGGASGRAGATAARTPDGPKVNLGKLDRSNKGKEKGAKRLGERVGRFWGGLRVQVRGLRLGRLGFGRGARRGRG